MSDRPIVLAQDARADVRRTISSLGWRNVVQFRGRGFILVLLEKHVPHDTLKLFFNAATMWSGVPSVRLREATLEILEEESP